eukprot:CAMPEP_0117438516 /NCGR_PEP_ID=MMETSP0759-20121206/2093_1 /TAXON_ID=63605 /ORGANISM="Percolomonas cosmopolitus, Strain WS" /LENGTH=475 /DNA_ID=CAMNT_0005230209 /DNA_START=14 /DNA_END=1441 /DNA_ORIENTATION=-
MFPSFQKALSRSLPSSRLQWCASSTFISSQKRSYRPKSLDKKKVTNPIDPRFLKQQSQEIAQKLQKLQNEHDPAQVFELGLHYLKNVEDKKEKGVELFKVAAEANYSEAVYILGWCYLHGEGVPQDKDEAMKWLRKSADQHHNPLAFFTLAELTEDKPQQKELFMKASKRNYPPAMYELALLEEDIEQRNYWMNQAAQHGHGAAMIEMGINHLYGYSGCAEDPVTARSWFAKAWKKATFKDARAGLYAGDCYRKGVGMDEVKPKKAILAYEWAAERGHPMGHQRLGEMYEEMGDETKAVEHYALAAEAGIPPAQYKYGAWLLRPEQESITEEQKEDGLRNIRNAAKMELPHAQYYLAKLIVSKAIEGEDEEVKNLMKSAASKGYTPAVVFVGDCHLNGEHGFPQNIRAAVHQYKVAAEQGDEIAQYNLGAAYMNGEGVDKNEEEGARWLQKSAAKGNVKAKMLLRDNDFVCSPGL